jgi:hypothetical protein
MTDNYSPESQYSESFKGSPEGESRASKALALALDVRKFEIELYWKRATYFWVFTGAALAAYLAALTGKDLENRPQALLLTSCIGLVFSVAWYFVNRASKFWQSNWEVHVDLLEDKVNGPIYKTVLTSSAPWWQPHGSYNFSVSKINQLLSLFIAVVFLLLVANTLHQHYELKKDFALFPTACLGITLTCLVLFVWLGRTGKANSIASVQLRKTTLTKYEKYDG